MEDELYAFVSYDPGVDNQVGIGAVIAGNCVFTTYFDVPYGCEHGDATWRNTVCQAIVYVLDGCDPNSINYNPALVGG